MLSILWTPSNNINNRFASCKSKKGDVDTMDTFKILSFVYNLLENNVVFMSLNTFDKSNPLSFGLNLIIVFPREVI